MTATTTTKKERRANSSFLVVVAVQETFEYDDNRSWGLTSFFFSPPSTFGYVVVVSEWHLVDVGTHGAQSYQLKRKDIQLNSDCWILIMNDGFLHGKTRPIVSRVSWRWRAAALAYSLGLRSKEVYCIFFPIQRASNGTWERMKLLAISSWDTFNQWSTKPSFFFFFFSIWFYKPSHPSQGKKSNKKYPSSRHRRGEKYWKSFLKGNENLRMYI